MAKATDKKVNEKEQTNLIDVDVISTSTEALTAVLKGLIAAKDVNAIKHIGQEANIVDIADAIYELDSKETLFFIRSLTTENAADLFAYLEPERQESLVEAFSSSEIKTILDEMFSDELAELIDDLPANLTQKILKAASPETRSTINEILKYEENTAGSIMNTAFVALSEDLTVGKALKQLKTKYEKANIETFSYIYVVNKQKDYEGYVSLKDLVFEDEDVILKDIAENQVVSVKATDDQEVAAEIMKKYDISVMPVLNKDDKIVGIITADDIIDIIQDEATEDIQKMAAIAPTEYPYSQSSVVELFKSRIGWLLILMITASATNLFLDKVIPHDLVIIFAALIPLMMDTAGNAGGQSGAVIIRALSTNDISTKEYSKVVWKELRIAFLIGSILFAANYGRMFLLSFAMTDRDAYVLRALPVSAALFMTIVIAKFLGASMPLLAKKLKLDPATVAAPLITTIVDLLALVILFVVFILFTKAGMTLY